MRKFAEVYSVAVSEKYQEAIGFLKSDPTKVQQVVAQMELSKAVPEELKSQLPDINDLENELINQ
jgi:hypothetical protein